MAVAAAKDGGDILKSYVDLVSSFFCFLASALLRLVVFVLSFALWLSSRCFCVPLLDVIAMAFWLSRGESYNLIHTPRY